MSEVVDLLQRLIQIDTVNPPGNETEAAELLREYLEDHGVRCELYGRTAERANLVARIPGRGEGPRLALLSHTDTVVADADEWSVDPWSGEVRNGEVWGRGALDMKGQVAASAVAMASLAREGFEPAGDLIFVACADEEVGEGEQFGLPWLVEAHPDTVEAEYSVNEGAGDRLLIGATPYYFCSTAEKMSSPFVLRVRGRSSHASIPGIADNALVKAAPLIERLAQFRPEPEVSPEVEALLSELLGEVPPADEVVQATRALGPAVAEMVEPLLSMTVAPTMITASIRRNVVPGICELTVDCRLLPGQTQDQAREAILDFLGEGDFDFEWTTGYGGTRSPLDTPLWEAVRSFVQGTEPGARAVPICVAGFTDSHWLRQKFGTVAYGFFPTRSMDPELAARLIHSADERAAIEDLELGVEFLRHAATTIGRSS